jgi:selenocysteine lyase/cysteine desulfurase
MEHLTTYLKGRLGDLKGAVVHSPSSWEESSALTTFSIPGAPAQQVFEGLWDMHRVHLRVVEEVDGNRVSTTFFNTEDEVDLLIQGLHSFLPAH